MARYLFLLLIVCSCYHSKPELKLSAVVAPAVFVLTEDVNLSSHQDTLYYKNEKFSGWLYLLHQKDTVLLEPYVKGLKEGVARKWYDNKQLAEERLYISNQKEGTHRGWWPNGNKQYVFTISNDEYQGEFSEWNREGALIKLFHYKNGHEEGSQQLWYDNGKTRANYVIANGRRYGLLGTKNCTNVSDSVFKK